VYELASGRAALQASFCARADTPTLAASTRRVVDRVLAASGPSTSAPADVALLAVGGYGRVQLFPHSDADVLILLTRPLDRRHAIRRALLGLLWDIGLEISHSVRTVANA
jgi:[protein-PII] uridylyltransferase